VLDQLILGENRNRNQPKKTQKGNKDNLGPTPKHPNTLIGDCKYKERERVTLHSSQNELYAFAPLLSCQNELYAPTLFSFPNRAQQTLLHVPP